MNIKELKNSFLKLKQLILWSEKDLLLGKVLEFKVKNLTIDIDSKVKIKSDFNNFFCI
jgi:hypothetical protein